MFKLDEVHAKCKYVQFTIKWNVEKKQIVSSVKLEAIYLLDKCLLLIMKAVDEYFCWWINGLISFQLYMQLCVIICMHNTVCVSICVTVQPSVSNRLSLFVCVSPCILMFIWICMKVTFITATVRLFSVSHHISFHTKLSRFPALNSHYWLIF